MAEITPMMKQYLEIKEQNKDSILFFRLGDFYEMFNEDAQLASRELDLTLTTRDRGKAAEDQTPMCGVPYHSSDAYIARLIAKGYKVAICEQTEDPALAKGLVKRDIIRVVTPGTVIDSACLDDRRGNFLCGVFLDEQNAGAAFCDMTTGHTHVTAFAGDDRVEHLCNELARFSPAEAVLSAGAYGNAELTALLRDKLSCAVECGESRFELKAAEKAIRAQFGEERFAHLPRGNPAAALALGALLSYLHETQKTDLSYIKDLEYYEQGRFMELDLTARRNLELTETIRAKEKRGSLLWVLDRTKTAMGARNLRAWLTRPLRDVAAIERRLGAVEALTKNTVAREELILALSGISDMERLIGDMMRWTNVTERELAEKGEIPTAFGETLSWDYLCYVRAHPVSWQVPTHILYGEHDNLTSIETISAFAERNGAALTVMPGGEHWFHTEEQMQFLDDWIIHARAI